MNITRRTFLAGMGSALLAGFYGASAKAGETLDLKNAWICGATDAPRFKSISNVTDADPRADLVTRHITDLVGLVPNFEVMEGDFEKNSTAIAAISRNKRFIVFDRAKFDWSSGRPSWWDIGVLAHEIGHHLNGHTVDGVGSRWQTEAEADWFAGFVIARLGGTREDALQAFSAFSKQGSKTHPPRHMRLQAVEAGWRHGLSL